MLECQINLSKFLLKAQIGFAKIDLIQVLTLQNLFGDSLQFLRRHEVTQLI